MPILLVCLIGSVDDELTVYYQLIDENLITTGFDNLTSPWRHNEFLLTDFRAIGVNILDRFSRFERLVRAERRYDREIKYENIKYLDW